MPESTAWEPIEFERYWLLLQSLEREPRYKTTRELADVLATGGFAVDIRTVQRMLGYFAQRFGLLSRQSSSGPGRPKEWAWPKNENGLAVPEIEPPRALTYQLAAQLLAPLLPGAFLEDLEPDFRRARKVLGQVGKRTKDLPDKVRLLPRGRGRLPAQVRQDVLVTLYNALLTERRVCVSYRSAAGGESSAVRYELSPLALLFRFDTMYLVHVAEPQRPGRDPDRVMEWPVHRFSRANMLEKPIRRPGGFDLDEHLRYPGFLRNQYLEKLRGLGPKIRLKALFPRATARYVQERPFGDDQRVSEATDDRMLVEATADNTRELLTELHDFAGDVEILDPPVLRAYFAELATKLSGYYGGADL